jgi:hypothetical protein
MTATYESIATYTAATDQNTITFTSLGSYTDLRIVANMQDTNFYGLLRFNSDNGSNYSRTWVYGTGTNALSSRTSNATEAYWGAKGVGSTYLPNVIDIMNYGNTTTNKTMLVRQSDAGGDVGAFVYLWRSTAAITSISFLSATNSTTIKTGSTITLYGIKAE